MSTTTTNFELIKPELSDAADITAYNTNWDTIDIMLSGVFEATSDAGHIYSISIPVEGVDWDNPPKGTRITIIPDKTSTSANPMLKINGKSLHSIWMPIAGSSTSLVSQGSMPVGWLVGGYPVTIIYSGYAWCTDIRKHSAETLYGKVPIEKGGTGVTTLLEAKAIFGVTALENAMDVALKGEVVTDPFDFDFFIGIREDASGYITNSKLFTIDYADYDKLELHACAAEVDAKHAEIITHELSYYYGAGWQLDCIETRFDIKSGNENGGNEQWTRILGYKIPRE